jgi:hypothetical protein
MVVNWDLLAVRSPSQYSDIYRSVSWNEQWRPTAHALSGNRLVDDHAKPWMCESSYIVGACASALLVLTGGITGAIVSDNVITCVSLFLGSLAAAAGCFFGFRKLQRRIAGF